MTGANASAGRVSREAVLAVIDFDDSDGASLLVSTEGHSDDVANGEGFDGSGGAAHTSKAPCSRELRGGETKRETLGSDVDSQARSRPRSNRSEQFFV
jgi:hypothetical protein